MAGNMLPRERLYYGEAESRSYLESLPPLPAGVGMGGGYLHSLCSRRWPEEPQPVFRYHIEGSKGLIRAYCIARGREFFSVDLHDTWEKAREDVSKTAYALLSEESTTLHPSRMPRRDGQGERVSPARSGSDDSDSSTSSENPYDNTALRAQTNGGRRRQGTGKNGR